MKNSKARVIVTLDCPRACPLCANRFASVQAAMMPLGPGNLGKLVGYEEVSITGGEPLLAPNFVQRVARACGRGAKVWLYTSIYREALGGLLALDLIDGVQFTLHAPVTREAVADLEAVERVLGRPHLKGLHNRLKVNGVGPVSAAISPRVWATVMLRPMLTEADLAALAGETCVPPGEDLYLFSSTPLSSSFHPPRPA